MMRGIPDLIVRGQSSDPKVVSEVEEEWDALCEEYQAYLASIQDRFPPGLRHVIESYFLQDAKVHSIGVREGQIVVSLQLDPPPQPLLTFRYDLVEAPRIDREVLPENLRDKSVIKQWQDDEIELVEGDPPTWRQSILLSNGWEITLHFRDVQVEEIEALLPAPRKSSFSGPADLPQTA